jgi:hypothetical protein
MSRELLVTAQENETPWWYSSAPNVEAHNEHQWVSKWAATGLLNQCLKDGGTLFTGGVGGYLECPSRADAVIRELADRGGHCLKSALPSKCGIQAIYVWPHAVVEVNIDIHEDAYVSIQIMSTRESWVYMLADKIKQWIVQKQPVSVRRGRVFMMGVAPMGGISFFRLPGNASVPLERDNYMPDVMSSVDGAIAELNSRTPNGRLTILDGPPGTGKTFLVYGLMQAVPTGMFIFIPPGMVEQLGDPSFVPALLRLGESKITGPSIFVIEDADACLVKRHNGNLSAISALLNLTSGIVGRMLDVRVLASSNAPSMEIDGAVTRKGRISQHITVDAIGREQANKVYNRLVGRNWEGGDTVLSDVYSEAINNGWQMPAYEEEAFIEVTETIEDVPPEEPEDASPLAPNLVKRRISSITSAFDVPPPVRIINVLE